MIHAAISPLERSKNTSSKIETNYMSLSVIILESIECYNADTLPSSDSTGSNAYWHILLAKLW